jgi:hypothetical protein
MAMRVRHGFDRYGARGLRQVDRAMGGICPGNVENLNMYSVYEKFDADVPTAKERRKSPPKQK